MNTSRIKQYLAHYLYGLFVKSFTGGISALDAFLGLAAGAALTTDIHSINWEGAAAVFGVTFLRTALSYFSANPLPADFPDEVVTTTKVETATAVVSKTPVSNP